MNTGLPFLAISAAGQPRTILLSARRSIRPFAWMSFKGYTVRPGDRTIYLGVSAPIFSPAFILAWSY